jgi:hypothetical protein
VRLLRWMHSQIEIVSTQGERAERAHFEDFLLASNLKSDKVS